METIETDSCIDGYMDGWMDGWMGRWMDGWMGAMTNGVSGGSKTGMPSAEQLLRNVFRPNIRYARYIISLLLTLSWVSTRTTLVPQFCASVLGMTSSAEAAALNAHCCTPSTSCEIPTPQRDRQTEKHRRLARHRVNVTVVYPVQDHP